MKQQVLIIALSIFVCYGQDPFLSNWMGQLLPLIGDFTVLDLSLPGTHDSITYDLSQIVSVGADDDSNSISWILHIASELGLTPSDWIRNQSQTQNLDVTQQLNNGIRFIDFRIMFTSDDWYCLHFMQSNNLAIVYLNEVRKWIDAHPQEVIVMWLSKHGNNCATGNNQFPGVTNEEKQAFWKQIEEVFDGVLLDKTVSKVNETSISDLIKKNQRVVLYTSDYLEFTGGSMKAYDGCLVDNHLCSSLTSEVQNYHCDIADFKNSSAIKAADKKESKFFLQSLATSGPGREIELAFLIANVDVDVQELTQECAQVFDIPGMTDWCPPKLLDISQLTNYYNQIVLEESLQNNYGYPNAIYIDAVDIDGTILTGTQTSLYGDHEVQRYSYAYNLILANLYYACKGNSSGLCGSLQKQLLASRSKYPYTRWNDPSVGRLVNWPVSL